MSAYACGDETIGRVLKAISLAGAYGEYYDEIQQLKDEYKNSPETLCTKLVKLNQYSLKEKYDEPYSLFIQIDVQKAVWLSKRLGHNQYQLLKSLSCYLYQSCEGNAGQHDLYRTLKAIRDNISYDLICEQEQYKQAKWG